MYESGGLIHGRSEWDSKTGEYSQPINWGNIMSLAVGGAIAAPFVAAAVGAGAGAGAGGAAGAGEAAGGTLASTAGATGIGTLAPGVAASGAVPAALGTGAAVGGTAVATAPTLGALMAPEAAAPVAAETAAAPLASTQIAPVTGALAPAVAPSGAVPAALAPTAASSTAPVARSLLRNAPAAAGNVVGNLLQARAAGEATDAQIAAQERSLAAQQAAGERAIGLLSPWANVGGAAVNRLGELMHLNVPASAAPAQASPAAVVDPTSGRRVGTPAGSVDTGVQAVPRLITMLDPASGERRQVPAEQQAHWESVGGRRIG
jgi:hypothetical protein